jgi:uncharacterized protein (TIGR02145 family)
MRALRMAFVAAALVAVFAGMAAAGVKYVAVVETEIDMEPGEFAKLKKSEVRLITDELRNAAVKTLPRGTYNVMTSETVMSQSGSVLSECAEENCIITLGSKIGADYIVRGKLGKIGTLFALSVSMFDTEDGFLVGSSNAVRSEELIDLLEKASGACSEMFKIFLSEPGAATATPASPTASAYQPPATPSRNQPLVAGRPPLTTFADGGPLRDNRDGKTYRTLVIGGKRWMAENLNYQTGSSWCYDNAGSNCNKYGRLYDWRTAKTICPAGWHLPSREEWGSLAKAAGGSWEHGTGGKAGNKLKAKSGWNNKGNGTDDYGFAALPGGNRSYLGGSFNYAGNNGNWWTATENRSSRAYYRGMRYGNERVLEDVSGKGFGMSVRCLGD